MAHNHAGVDATTAASGAEHQKRLMMSLGLTSTVFIAEVVSAIVTGSLALLVDAGHMLTDMSVLIASTVTAVLMQRKPSNKRTWGWARLEVLTAAVGALVLLIVGIYALVEAGMRLEPPTKCTTCGCCCSWAYSALPPTSVRSSSSRGKARTT